MCIVICGGGKHINVTELVVGLVQRIQTVKQRLHLAAHLVIIDRRGEDDDLGFLDLCHDFGYIILQNAVTGSLARHAADAEPDIFAVQGHEFNLMTRILRAALAFLCQNLRIAISAQACGNYKNLLCHRFNAPFALAFARQTQKICRASIEPLFVFITLWMNPLIFSLLYSLSAAFTM